MPLAAPGIPAISETLFIRKYSSQFSVVKFVLWQKSCQSLEGTVMLSLTMVLAQTSNWSLDKVLLPNMQILEGKRENQCYYMVPGKWNLPFPLSSSFISWKLQVALVCYIISQLQKDGGSRTKTAYLFPLRVRSIKLLFQQNWERYKKLHQCDLLNLVKLP